MGTGRPVADDTVAGWTNLKGSVLNLWKNVDDTVESSSDAVSVTMPAVSYGGASITGQTSSASYTTPGATLCTDLRAGATAVLGGATNDNAHKVRMVVPNATDRAKLTPIVLVLHGVGNDEDIIGGGAGTGGLAGSGGFGTNGMTDAALDLGWPVLAANMNGVSWGNDTARTGLLDIWTWVSGIFNCPGFLVYGISMGACAALNYLLDVDSLSLPILNCATNSGATNFQYTYDHSATLVGGMRTAYGLGSVTSSDPTYIAAVDTDNGGHDPQKQNASEFPTIPFRFYVGNADATINKANNTDLFATKLSAASWPLEAATVVYSGDHTAAASYQPSDWTAFCQRSIET